MWSEKHQELYYITLVIGHYFVYNIIISCRSEWSLSLSPWLNGKFFSIDCTLKCFWVILCSLCLRWSLLSRIWLTPIFHFIAQLQIQYLFIYLYIGFGLVSQPQLQTVRALVRLCGCSSQHTAKSSEPRWYETNMLSTTIDGFLDWRSPFFPHKRTGGTTATTSTIPCTYRFGECSPESSRKNTHKLFHGYFVFSAGDCIWTFFSFCFFWGTKRRSVVASLTVWVNQLQVNRCTRLPSSIK